MLRSSALHHDLNDPRATREGLSVIPLGHQTYLAAKAKGEISMSGKPRTRGSSLGGWLGKTRMTW